MPIRRPGADIVDRDINGAAIAGAFHDAVIERTLEHRREEGETIDAHVGNYLIFE
jgi:hypothetical protein